MLIVALLAATLVFARFVAGTKSWISLGLMQMQPSEMAKIVMILVCARLFAEYKRDFLTTRRTPSGRCSSPGCRSCSSSPSPTWARP